MAAAKAKEDKNVVRIKEIRKEDANKVCFNCKEKGPAYLNTTHYTFVCTQCAGIHREFNHRVKSVTVSTFSDDEVAHLVKGGNAAAAKMWLAKWDPKRDPVPDSSDKTKMKEFISRIFVTKEFMKTDKDKDKKKKKQPDDESDEEVDSHKKQKEKEKRKSSEKKKQRDEEDDDTPPVRDLKTVLPNPPKLVVKKEESESSGSDDTDEEEEERRRHQRKKERKERKAKEKAEAEKEKQKPSRVEARTRKAASEEAPKQASSSASPAKKQTADLIDLDSIFSSQPVTSQPTNSFGSFSSSNASSWNTTEPDQTQAPPAAPASVAAQSQPKPVFVDPFADLISSTDPTPSTAAPIAAQPSVPPAIPTPVPAYGGFGGHDATNPPPYYPWGMPAAYPSYPYGVYSYAAAPYVTPGTANPYAYPGVPPASYGAYYPAPTADAYGMNPSSASPPAAVPVSTGPPKGPNWNRAGSIPGPSAGNNVTSKLSHLSLDDGNPFS
jgi:hypothetical protein